MGIFPRGGTRVGDFETPEDEATVALSSDAKPTYIVAGHPRFTSYGETHVRYYALNDEGRYSPEWDPADRLGEAFGYPRHEDTGQCM